jgi:hypothetical protein
MSKLSDIAFERYEALFEQELYREKETPMWASEHEKAARRKVYEAVIAECSSGPSHEGMESAPRNASPILVYVPSRGWMVAHSRTGWEGWFTIPGDYTCKPTRWMPLPPSPSATKENV